MIIASHEILKFVCYPISNRVPTAPASSGSTRWPSGACRRPISGSRIITHTAKLEEFLPWFKDWKFDWLDVPGLIENCAHAYEYPLVDRDPVTRWTFSRVTLMSDAAHPMYPIGSNGASQAILDAARRRA